MLDYQGVKKNGKSGLFRGVGERITVSYNFTQNKKS